ncbi:MAG: xanthine dehydrogenase family protein subunit M [Gammaproteobacteria bacterium]|nr:xanthine dehydrogenase family protein subunit M [Gammaproteobacteria bacterium]
MNYFRPSKLSQALVWLADNNAGIAAGCTDLFATTDCQYLKKAKLENLLDITAIDELCQIDETGDGVSIGTGVKWSEIVRHNLPPAFDGLKAAASEVGSVQIQNSGTIGGNLCNASPAADGVPPLLILDASVKLSSVSRSRILPLSQFLRGARQTALNQDEILTAILIPNSAISGVSAFKKLGARKYLVISIAMAAVRLSVENKLIKEIAISVGSCSAVAARLKNVEAILAGCSVDDNFHSLIKQEILQQDLSPIDDIRADAAYRNIAARELIIRTVEELITGGKAK